MDDELRRWLYDPQDAHRFVLGRRPPDPDVVACVVSDAVWHQVIHLLRWSAATTGSAEVDAGRWWRLAAGCADLLRRLPALCDEAGEPFEPTAPPDDPDLPGPVRVALTSVRLAALLRSPEPVPLWHLAGEVDALGAAAISALAQTSSWALPASP
jgi:hypothetical protein